MAAFSIKCRERVINELHYFFTTNTSIHLGNEQASDVKTLDFPITLYPIFATLASKLQEGTNLYRITYRSSVVASKDGHI